MSTTIRYNLPCLWPSEIASQLYCEYKVHLHHAHPEVEIELPALEQGEEGHALLASLAQPITAEEIENSILEGKRLAVCEWTLEGEFRGVPVRGRPDFLDFEGKNAHLVLDFKFSGVSRPFRNQEFQAEIYSLLAEKNGFGTKELIYGIVKFPRLPVGGTLNDRAQVKSDLLQSFQNNGTLKRIYERCQRERTGMLTRGSRQLIAEAEGWTVYLYRFDRARALGELYRALDFWLAKREPQPEAMRPNKCFACPFNAVSLCEHALTNPDPRFEVQPGEEGKVKVIRQPLPLVKAG